jgi:hypothetical protein
MKTVSIASMLVVLLSLIACNNSQPSSATTAAKTNVDSTKVAQADTTPMVTVSPTFSNVDPKVASSLKAVVDHYLHIKNALVDNSGNEAARGGKAMGDAMSKVDKSLLTAEQKKVYDDIEEDLKEHAEHIGKSGGDIAHQREHFVMMSEDVYDLAKAFGAGQPLYHDHCPMANDNKGAMWLSETRSVKNPYFGGKMNECVKVMEVIK